MSYIKTTSSGVNICHTDTEPQKGGGTYGRELWLNRFEYKGHYREINNTRRLKALIREGQYCFPGGYAIVPYTYSGEPVCLDCVKENYSNVIYSYILDIKDEWYIAFTDIYYGVEDNGETICSHCGKDWENI